MIAALIIFITGFVSADEEHIANGTPDITVEMTALSPLPIVSIDQNNTINGTKNITVEITELLPVPICSQIDSERSGSILQFL